MGFHKFAEEVRKQFNMMAESGPLYTVNVKGDDVNDKYLSSFEDGTNEIYIERPAHECQTCRTFIKNIGNVVAIIDGKKVSVWDVEAEGIYAVVAKELSKFILGIEINNVFRHFEQKVAVATSLQELEDGSVKKWHHFSCEVPKRFVNPDKGAELGNYSSQAQLFKRGLESLDLESAELVVDSIENGSLYRGEEKLKKVNEWIKLKKQWDSLEKAEDELGSEAEEIFIWNTLTSADSSKIGAMMIRNDAIGTLLINLTEGMELDVAAEKFGKMMDPANYKRPKTIATKAMIEAAMKTLEENNLKTSLYRRHAVIEDVSINDVLFADRDIKTKMKDSIEDLLMESIPDKVDNKNIKDISIDKFMSTVVPKIDSMEVMFKHNMQNNLINIIAPVYEDVEPLFKWNNNFSWSYNNDLADSSMKDRVKSHGGNVEGDLRFSIQWNDGDNNQNDFDAHCIEPHGNIIMYQNKGHKHLSSGMLDVDIVSPGNEIAVENIIYSDKNEMPYGSYDFLVHNFRHNGGSTGFTAEIEFDGTIYSYAYGRELIDNEKVKVATVTKNNDGTMTIKHHIEHQAMSKDVWNIKTEKYVKVQTMMLSPNHWGENEIGNKHFIFILEGCKNSEKTRGMYNEFLNGKLNTHRKVFELLGSKMKVEPTDNQLAGLGFSSTKSNEVIVKTFGEITRTFKVII